MNVIVKRKVSRMTDGLIQLSVEKGLCYKNSCVIRCFSHPEIWDKWSHFGGLILGRIEPDFL